MVRTGQTMFERHGGFATVRRIVSEFYDRVLESDVVAHHFEHVEMRRLIDHQAQFVSTLLGGPASFSDEHLERIHRRLDITTDEFREMIELLTDTLGDFGFEAGEVDEVRAALRRREGVIVGRR
jgi:hemoglobin